jgi:hypothetical protein
MSIPREAAKVNLQPEVEGDESQVELEAAALAEIMEEPPGPTKASTRLHYRQRPRSGPFEPTLEDT